MIRSFKSKALAELFQTGKSAKIAAKMHKRIRVRLDALNEAVRLEDLQAPGYDFHALKGHKPARYTIHVNGPWCITFEFDGTDAYRVDFEQYH
ncbi:MAG: type II toxin-antitoxin system RelE/ParE family toxin [Rhizomicrobium sp.]